LPFFGTYAFRLYSEFYTLIFHAKIFEKKFKYVFFLFVGIFRQIDINRLFLTRLGKFEMGYICLIIHVSKSLQNSIRSYFFMVQKAIL